MNYRKATGVTWIPEHNSAASYSMRRYWLELASAWREGDRYTPLAVIEPTDEKRVPGLQGRLSRAWQRSVVYPAMIRRSEPAAIAHVLDHSWTDLLSNVPAQTRTVVTVHDLIPLRFPGELSHGQVIRFRRRLERLPKLDALIAVSEYTKSEISSLFAIAPEKIHVVPNGAAQGKCPAPKQGRGKPQATFRIGSIGSILRRKNLGILPSSLRHLRNLTDRPIVLERLGEFLPDELAKEIRAILGEGSLVELGSLPDEEVRQFYGRQDVIAFPSLYEGFGLPVLEAMAAGVPVVSSSATSLPEVGGEQVLYFDPQDPEAFARQLAIVANGELPESWVEDAYRRSCEFTWRRTLEGVYRVYDSILK